MLVAAIEYVAPQITKMEAFGVFSRWQRLSYNMCLLGCGTVE